MVFFSGEGGSIYETTDAGVNWTLLDFGLTGTFHGLKAFNQDTIYAAAGGKFTKTLNGGQSFTTVSIDDQSYNISFWNENEGFYLGRQTSTSNGRIYKTTDAGQTWITKHTVSGNPLFKIEAYDENISYACGASGVVVKSIDGGNNWSNVTLPNTTLTCHGMDVISANEVWVSCSGGYLAHTTNGGTSWTMIYLGTSFNIYDVHFVNPSQGFICGASGKLYRTRNGGVNWEALSSGTTVFDLRKIQFFNEKEGVCFGTFGVQTVTHNGGNSFKYVSLYQTQNDFYSCDFLNPFEGFAGGTFGTLVTLEDRRNVIRGRVFADFNNNGVQNVGEPGIPNATVKTQTNEFAVTDSLGDYAIWVGINNYTLSMSQTFNGFSTAQTHTANFTDYFNSDSLNNFPLTASSAFQNLAVELISTGPVRNANNRFNLTVQNLGTSTTSGTAIVNYNPANTFVSAQGSPTQGTNQLTWNISNLQPFAKVTYDFILDLNGMILGDTLKTYALVNVTGTDAYLTDNNDTLRNIVVGSFDPNDKLVQPGNKVPLSFVQNGKEIDYTIRFQNTGTDTAFKIWVVDTLSNDLDFSTFRMITASHPYSLELDSSRVRWTFDPIALVDTNTNEAKSHGFIHFKIKAKTSVAAGTQIDNYAAIYFDRNSPVITPNGYLQIAPLAPTASNASTCVGGTASLSASGTGLQWFSSMSSSTVLGSGSPFVTGVLAGDTAFYVQSTINGISSDRIKVNVTTSVLNAPSASGTSICSGNTASLTASGATNYRWYSASTGGTLLNSTANYTTPTLSTTTTYYVESILGSCTSSRTAVTVTVNSVSAPTAAGTSICSGQTATLNASNGTVYQWFTVSTGGTSVGTGANFTTPTLTSNTTYYVQNIASGCTSARTAVNVTVTNISAPTAQNKIICLGNSTTLNASGSGTISWYANSSGGTALATGANFTTPTITSNTTYYVEAVSGACTSSRTPVTVSLENASNLPFSQDFEGTFVPSGWSIGNPDASLTWEQSATVTGISGASTKTAYMNFYDYNNANGQKDTLFMPLLNLSNANNAQLVFDRSYAPYSTTDSQYYDSLLVIVSTNCGSSWNQIYVKGGPTLATMAVNNGAGHTPIAASNWKKDTLSLAAYANTQLKIAFVGINRYGQNLFLDNINILTCAASVPSVNPMTICSGNTASLTATGGSNYLWYAVATGGSSISNSTTFTTPTLTSNTTYYVENVSGSCTSSRIAVNVTVNTTNAPTASGVSICSGTTTDLTASGGTNYAWYTVATGGTKIASTPTIITGILTSNTTYYVENIANGCTSARTPVLVTVNTTNAPTASNASICSGNTASLSASGGSSYAWYSVATGGTKLASTASYTTPILTANTTYYVENIENGCTSSRTTVTVNVNAVNASFSANTNTLTASPSGATYQWLLNGTPISGATSENYTITQSGQYAVIVTQNGCSDTTANQTITFTTLDFNKQSEIKVYPNPFENEFNIQVQESAETHYKLFDLLGKEIKSGSFTGTELTIPVQNLSKGTYLLRVISVSKAQEFRVVKN